MKFFSNMFLPPHKPFLASVEGTRYPEVKREHAYKMTMWLTDIMYVLPREHIHSCISFIRFVFCNSYILYILWLKARRAAFTNLIKKDKLKNKL